MSFENEPHATNETLDEQKGNVEADVYSEALRAFATPDMGRVTLVRVMNLEGHQGVSFEDTKGGYRYTPDNQQYPDQGDFAFSGAKALDSAVTRGYPNHLGNIHLVSAHEDDIVEPYPDDMPGVVYVKNGAEVVAQKVPKEIIQESVDRVNSGQDPYTTDDVIKRLTS